MVLNHFPTRSRGHRASEQFHSSGKKRSGGDEDAGSIPSSDWTDDEDDVPLQGDEKARIFSFDDGTEMLDVSFLHEDQSFVCLSADDIDNSLRTRCRR